MLNHFNSPTIDNYIDGMFTPPLSQSYIDNYNPALGEIYSKIADSDAADIEVAVAAAQAAFPTWAAMPAEQRSRLLYALADAIEHYLEPLALAECEDNGKPLHLAKTIDIPRAAANFRFFATALLHFATETHASAPNIINYTLRQPIGTVACISPWNLPLYLFTWKIAPALAAGNCVVAKPSEITPRTAYLLAEICQKIGLPAGVLNIVNGYGHKVGHALCSHPQIKAISFTGGTTTGATIAATAAPKFKKLSLELGGKNPNIIFADCDFDTMLQTTLRSSFSNQGQICLCGSRILVEAPLYEKFTKAFVDQVKKMRVGDPLLATTDLGAVVSEAHQQKIMSYIQLAQQEGGIVLAGGDIVKPEGRCNKGWFVQPTVIANLSQNCRTNREEIFGPVVTIEPFNNDEQALSMANSTEYGLSATIWTQNLRRAHQFADQLQCGIVWINCWLVRDLRTPFGGVKNSGIGREGGWEALRFFTEAKNVCIKN